MVSFGGSGPKKGDRPITLTSTVIQMYDNDALSLCGIISTFFDVDALTALKSYFNSRKDEQFEVDWQGSMVTLRQSNPEECKRALVHTISTIPKYSPNRMQKTKLFQVCLFSCYEDLPYSKSIAPDKKNEPPSPPPSEKALAQITAHVPPLLLKSQNICNTIWKSKLFHSEFARILGKFQSPSEELHQLLYQALLVQQFSHGAWVNYLQSDMLSKIFEEICDMPRVKELVARNRIKFARMFDTVKATDPPEGQLQPSHNDEQTVVDEECKEREEETGEKVTQAHTVKDTSDVHNGSDEKEEEDDEDAKDDAEDRERKNHEETTAELCRQRKNHEETTAELCRQRRNHEETTAELRDSKNANTRRFLECLSAKSTREANRKLKGDLEASNESCRDLSMQLETALKANGKLEEDLKATKESCHDLSTQLKTAQKANGKLGEDLKATNEYCRDLSMKLETVRKANGKLGEDLKAAKESNGKLPEDLAAAKESTDGLDTKLKSIEKQLESAGIVQNANHQLASTNQKLCEDQRNQSARDEPIVVASPEK